MRAVEMRRWTRDEYERMISAGLFAAGERLELVDGEILQMTPQGSLHATAVQLTQDALRAAFGFGFTIRAQMPLAIDPHSEPEPDIAVVPGNPRDYRNSHPFSAALVVEIADTTLEYDRQRKGNLYARNGIKEYWIINLNDRCVEAYRNPVQRSYASSQVFLPGNDISPLARPEAKIAVADILP